MVLLVLGSVNFQLHQLELKLVKLKVSIVKLLPQKSK